MSESRKQGVRGVPANHGGGYNSPHIIHTEDEHGGLALTQVFGLRQELLSERCDVCEAAGGDCFAASHEETVRQATFRVVDQTDLVYEDRVAVRSCTADAFCCFLLLLALSQAMATQDAAAQRGRRSRARPVLRSQLFEGHAVAGKAVGDLSNRQAPHLFEKGETLSSSAFLF